MTTNRNTRQRALCFDAPLTPEDMPRLGTQQRAVLALMLDGVWRTLADIRECLHNSGIAASEAGISARLRDLRKKPYELNVERRRVIGANGLFQYRIN